MQDRYRWTDSDMAGLQIHLRAAHQALDDAYGLLMQLQADMDSDLVWTGDHKPAFLAWMSLVEEFHRQLANSDIGASAVEALDSFLSNLGGYYAGSSVYATLRGVG